MQRRDIVDRRRIGRQRVGLAIVDHLQPMLDRPKEPIGRDQRVGLFADVTGGPQTLQRGHRRWRAQRAIAAAMNQLMDLSEEFDFANAAAAAFQIIAWAKNFLAVTVANPLRHRPHFLDSAEVERAAPYEGPDRFQEALAKAAVPRDGTGSHECRSLPGDRA